MPFGKYKGCSLSEIPDDYLDWLTSIDLSDWLSRAVEKEIAKRSAPPPPPPPPPRYGARAPAFVDKELVRKLIKTGYRTLANRLHPDHGGSHEEMCALTAQSEWLETLVDDLIPSDGNRRR